jgi:hypothetical protein
VYKPTRRWFKTRWSDSPVLRRIVGPDSLFQEVNLRNKMEGGPKGIAIHDNDLAVCSPEHGIRIYPFRENGLRA